MSNARTRGRPPHPDLLTPAEWRVAEGVRHGLSNPRIARGLGVSTDAVKFHVSNVLAKLGLASRTELRRWAGVAADSALAAGGTRGVAGMGDTTQAFGQLGQVARSASDIGAATAWYRDVLGLPLLFEAGKLSFFDCHGTRLMLAEGDGAASSVLYFRVADLHGEVARLEAAGAKLVSAPHRIHVHADGMEEWMAFVADNEDRPLGLMAQVAPKG
ncbi:MAG: VOC family protein [Novosphingobium sp.]|nr:VOC family protein [Novosphingobium sp.]